MNSSTVLTVWDNEKLVGLTRVLDDTEMLAQIHYVLVHPDYQGNGIAGKMVEYIKKKYKNYLYIEAMPEEKSNVPFYTKHGFSVMDNGAAIQIWNYRTGYSIARVSKELFHMTDTYIIDVQNPGNALDVLMFVLAIDAEKCSRN